VTTIAQALLIARGVERVRDIGHAFDAVVERWLPAAQLAREQQAVRAEQQAVLRTLLWLGVTIFGFGLARASWWRG